MYHIVIFSDSGGGQVFDGNVLSKNMYGRMYVVTKAIK
jgi:hypothetical protein